MLAALLLLAPTQVVPDAGPDLSVTFPAQAALQGTVAGGTPLEWWTADGNGPTEDMLVGYHESSGAAAPGSLSTGAGKTYGWLGDIVDVGGTAVGNSVLSRELFSIDLATATCTPLTAPWSAQWGAVHSLAYDAVGDRLFAVDAGARQLLLIDRATGSAGKVGNATLASWPLVRSLAYDPGLDRLYAVDQPTSSLLAVSPVTGAATFLTTVAPMPGTRIEELAFVDGQLYAVHGREDGGMLNRAQLQRLDLTTGEAVDLGPELQSVSAHCLFLVSLPEASQWSMLSGPGTVAFAEPTALSTQARFSRPGVYVLELAVSTPGGTVTDTVTVTSAGYEAFCYGDGTGAPCPCGNEAALGEGCANSTGAGGLLRNIGGVSAGADDAVLEASQLPAGKAGILFAGVSTKNGGLGKPWGDGLRCAKGLPTVRFPLKVSGPGGTIVQATPVALAKGFITAGSTWYVQCWHRDLPSPCGTQTNLTSGIAITFGP
jgi:hypothetical protein